MESGFNCQEDWARDEEANTMQTLANAAIVSDNIFIAEDLFFIKGPFPYLIIYMNSVKKEACDKESVFW
jgi:hypothetical protein